MGFLDLVDDFQQVLPILILEHRLRELAHTLFRNLALTVSYSLQTGHF